MDNNFYMFLDKIRGKSYDEIQELIRYGDLIKEIDYITKYDSGSITDRELIYQISDLYLDYENIQIQKKWPLISKYTNKLCLKLYNNYINGIKQDIYCNTELINLSMDKLSTNNKKGIFIIIDGMSFVEWRDFTERKLKLLKNDLSYYLTRRNKDIKIIERISFGNYEPCFSTLPSATKYSHEKMFKNISDNYLDRVISTKLYGIFGAPNLRELQSNSAGMELLTEDKIKVNLDNTWNILNIENKCMSILWLSVDGKLNGVNADEDIFAPGGHLKGPRKVLDRLYDYFLAISKFLIKNPNAEIFITSDHGMHSNMDSYILGKSSKIDNFDISSYFKNSSVNETSFKFSRYASRAIFIEIFSQEVLIQETISKLVNAKIIKLIIEYNTGRIVENLNQMEINKKYLLIPYGGIAFNNYDHIGEHGGIEFDEFIIPYINLSIDD